VKAKIIAVAATLPCLFAPAGADGGAPIRLYLPRAIQVASESLTLGNVSIIRSSDAALHRLASAIAMGKAPPASGTSTINRSTILSRLAAAGIPAERATLSGAEQITVSWKQSVVPAKEILDAAEKLLHTSRPGPEGVKWQATRGVKDLVFPAGRGKLELRAKLISGAKGDCQTVRVAAWSGGREVAARQVIYKPTYAHRRAVATSSIPAGTKITRRNASVRTVASDKPAEGEFVSPFGLTAKVDLSAGEAVRPDALLEGSPGVVIRRGQTIVMMIQGPGFSISGLSRALQDGRPGEIIKVQNVDSGRIVAARVSFDGTVTPIGKG